MTAATSTSAFRGRAEARKGRSGFPLLTQFGPPESTHVHVPQAGKMPLEANGLPRLPLTGPQRSARFLLVPAACLGWSFGGRCDGAPGSKAIGGDLGCRRGRLLRVDATR